MLEYRSGGKGQQTVGETTDQELQTLSLLGCRNLKLVGLNLEHLGAAVAVRLQNEQPPSLQVLSRLHAVLRSCVVYHGVHVHYS